MKKVIVSFLSGQVLQLLLLFVAMRLTYSTNVIAFCGILGALATLLLCVGSGLQLIEMTPAGRIAEARDKLSGTDEAAKEEARAVMEQKLSEVGTDA